MSKLKQACFHSATIAWTYFLGIGGLILDTVLASPDVTGDVKGVILDTIKNHPHATSWAIIGFALITFAARMRSIITKPPQPPAPSQ